MVCDNFMLRHIPEQAVKLLEVLLPLSAFDLLFFLVLALLLA